MRPAYTIINFIMNKTGLVLLVSFIMLSGCKKQDELSPDKQQVEWMKVLGDEGMLKPGKVLTDGNDNIYIYFTGDKHYAAVEQLSPSGHVNWKKEFTDYAIFDMTLAPNGNIILCGLGNGYSPESGIVMVSISNSGVTLNQQVFVPSVNPGKVFTHAVSANLSGTSDGYIIVSGTMEMAGDPNYSAFITKTEQLLSTPPSFNKNYVFFPGLGGPQPSIIDFKVLQAGLAYVFMCDVEGVVGMNPNFNVMSGLITGLINPDGNINNYKFRQTGYYNTALNVRSGWVNSYGKLLPDKQNGFLSWRNFSKALGSDSPVPNEFLRINSLGVITDSIPFSLPENYIANSMAINSSLNFYMTSCLQGELVGSTDFSPQQTSFSHGNSAGPSVSKTFSIKNSYTDNFTSVACTSEGDFICFGQLQGFYASSFQPVLIKLKKP
jgi:hypothetical protein